MNEHEHEHEREQRAKVVALTGDEREVKARLRELFGADDGQHYYDTQVEPQIRLSRRRAAGEDVELALVNTDPTATEGFIVTCHDCGRSARMPTKPPKGTGVLCPACQRARGL